ncbi:flavin reductase [Micromonospora sp. WMMD558]|uniref:flavin reductase n=1 Tax=Micromonospora sp. WMMD558 TaxID=3403462 RepID=UPI003BF5EF74
MHLPIRPDWTCAACGDLWPCPTRRRQLTAHYHQTPVSLMVYLIGFFVEACQDLPGVPAGMLHQRFLAWPAATAAGDWHDSAPAGGQVAGALRPVPAIGR